jgi:hypothetical protein
MHPLGRVGEPDEVHDRDKISTREFEVGVFTQPGPISDMGIAGHRPTVPHHKQGGARFMAAALS